MKKNKINKILKVMEKLRDPKKGCAWDKKQTLNTIIPYSIEEVYEVAEQVYTKNYIKLKEELGDLLFQVIYMSQIASEKNKFNFYDVVDEITNKMMKRHPHVFKNKKFKNIKEFKNWWEKSKNKNNKSLLDGIPITYPAMLQANKIQKKVASVGFEYLNNEQAINKVIEESIELKKELKNNNRRKIKEELGDLIFASLDVSRKLKFNPEEILKKGNRKFINRWKKLEKIIKKENKDLNKLNSNQLNKYWNLAKIN
tara:strand:- start:201 stop:965 length:765 start_codon:yes stop_codon:yes gene_type:complete